MPARPWLLSAVLFAAFATTSAALGQCTANYVPGLGMPGADNRVDALTTWDPDGAGPASPVVVLGGDFQFAGTMPANRVVAWQPQSGSYENIDQFGGLGGRAIGVRGLATGSLPLAPLLPQALPGCNLLVSPDLLDLHLPNVGASGTADITFPIPRSVALTGAVLHLQVVPVVLSAVGAITEFSATNALTLTIGT